MKAKVLFKYICQYYHECYMTGFDDWVSEKVVDTESEAEAWVDEAPEHEDRRYFRIKFFSDSDAIKEQFESMKNNIKSDFPKDVVISAFESTLKTIEEEWNMPLYSKGEVTNLPEKHKNLLLIVKTDGGTDFLGSLITCTIASSQGNLRTLRFDSCGGFACRNQHLHPLTCYSVSRRHCHFCVSTSLIGEVTEY